MNRADTVIIGAGLMGAATALNLALAGKKVILLEKEVSGIHASAVNAGGVRRLNRAFAEIPISAAAGEMWPRLEKLVGDDCGFHAVGQVRIAPGKNELEQLSKRVAKVRALGFEHEELIDEAEVRRLVPAYGGSCSGGIVSRSDGHANPARTVTAFVRAAVQAGVELQTRSQVSSILRTAEGFRIETTAGLTFHGETVVNCAGGWGKKVAALVNEKLPVEAEALTMMVTARMKRFLTPVVGVHGHKLSFKQTENGTVVIGGGHRAKLDMGVEKNYVQIPEIRISANTVRKHFPIMQQSQIVRSWAGIEGMVPDGLPIISESRDVPGFFHVCGFSSHGYQLAPMIGRLAASMVQRQEPELPLQAFSLSRFSSEGAK